MSTYLERRRVAPLAGERDSAVRTWLLIVAALVVAMITVGGATRLTDSGLSITEWQPILGAIPPLSDADWQEAFRKYKQIPEYREVNAGMSLEEFKVIYWWEWGHRFLGRLIGVVFALPLAAFWIAGRLPPRLAPKLLGVLALGAVQGVVGWYMVRSGLVDRVDVSHYRLALHLGLAFLILALLVWLALETGPRPRRSIEASPAQQRVAFLLVVLVLMQVLLGALVAGLKAGLAYNTWPLMDGRLVPAGLGALSPWWLNAFENAATVQFNHRIVAYLLAVAVLWHTASLARCGSDAARSAAVLAAAVLSQAALGVWTLLWSVPLPLGLAHQAGAAIVLVIAVWHLHRVARS